MIGSNKKKEIWKCVGPKIYRKKYLFEFKLIARTNKMKNAEENRTESCTRLICGRLLIGQFFVISYHPTVTYSSSLAFLHFFHIFLFYHFLVTILPFTYITFFITSFTYTYTYTYIYHSFHFFCFLVFSVSILFSHPIKEQENRN